MHHNPYSDTRPRPGSRKARSGMTHRLILTAAALVLGLAGTAGCSPDKPGQPADTAVGTETPASPSTADVLPEVVILHGPEEMESWLTAENWWGEVNRAEQLTVPHVLVTGIHPSWKEVAVKLPVPVKKELFYRLMLPLVMHANLMVSTFRENLLQARAEYTADGRISEASLAVMKRLLPLLPGATPVDADSFTPDHPEMNAMIDDLLYRVDVVPAGLALGQAAYESGYGTSRFAIEGNSLFGQWTYGGEGLVPKQQRKSSKGDHRIKSFEWPFDSVRGYFINLFTHPAYEDFRRLRADLRAAGRPLDSLVLADGLIRYSERGQEYVDSLKGMIRSNGLDIADRAVFRDEPLRFVISEQTWEDVERMKAEVERLRASGELAEIIERMRLE